jgi:hypothetical protein
MPRGLTARNGDAKRAPHLPNLSENEERRPKRDERITGPHRRGAAHRNHGRIRLPGIRWLSGGRVQSDAAQPWLRQTIEIPAAKTKREPSVLNG